MKSLFTIIATISLVLFLSSCEKVTYIVKFESNGSNSILSVETEANVNITEPVTPIKEGHTFLGWYSDSTLNTSYDFSNPVTGNLSLYAKWSINQYSISFESKDGSLVDAITQNYDTTLNEPTDPTKENHSFIGWYSDEKLTTPYTFSTMPAQNITLFAKWSINQYSISFESKDGSLVDTIRQDYETTVIEPTHPTRVGYTFGGWYSEASLTKPYTFTTMPGEDITLYAKWDINIYNIIFNLNHGTNGANPVTYTIETSTIVLDEPTKEGYTFNGWFDNVEYTGETIRQITLGTRGDTNLFAKWSINQYSISFESKDGSLVDTIRQDYETTVIEPTHPTRIGYTFGGWYSEASLTKPYTFTTMPGEDITLYAKWDINIYNIIFNLNDGTNGANPVTYTIETSTIVLDEPTKEGYTFNGWFDNVEFTGETIRQITLGTTGDTNLFAKWSINQYSISFINVENVILKSYIFDYNEIIDGILLPENPDVKGYDFIQWLIEIPNNMPSRNIIVLGEYIPQEFTILFEENGGTLVLDAINDYNAEIETPVVEREGFSFLGWYLDDTLQTLNTYTTMPAQNITLYAKWSINQYSISFESKDGSLVDTIRQDYETTVIEPTHPTRIGYTFGGWYSEASLTKPYTFTTMPGEDITLYAKWDINQYTLRFIGAYLNIIESYVFDFNSNLSIEYPYISIIPGKIFLKWDSEIPDTMPAYDLTINALYSEEFSIENVSGSIHIFGTILVNAKKDNEINFFSTTDFSLLNTIYIDFKEVYFYDNLLLVRNDLDEEGSESYKLSVIDISDYSIIYTQVVTKQLKSLLFNGEYIIFNFEGGIHVFDIYKPENVITRTFVESKYLNITFNKDYYVVTNTKDDIIGGRLIYIYKFNDFDYIRTIGNYNIYSSDALAAATIFGNYLVTQSVTYNNNRGKVSIYSLVDEDFKFDVEGHEEGDRVNFKGNDGDYIYIEYQYKYSTYFFTSYYIESIQEYKISDPNYNRILVNEFQVNRPIGTSMEFLEDYILVKLYNYEGTDGEGELIVIDKYNKSNHLSFTGTAELTMSVRYTENIIVLYSSTELRLYIFGDSLEFELVKIVDHSLVNFDTIDKLINVYSSFIVFRSALVNNSGLLNYNLLFYTIPIIYD